MKKNVLKTLTTTLTILFFSTAGFGQQVKDKPYSGIPDTSQFKSVDLIYMDKDLSIFANLVTLSGLTVSLALTDQEHTLFVPSNEAFASMTIEDFARLTDPSHRGKLIDFVNRHYVPTKIMSSDFTEQSVITHGNNEQIPITVDGDTTMIGGASITAADIETSNGVLHVINKVIEPVN